MKSRFSKKVQPGPQFARTPLGIVRGLCLAGLGLSSGHSIGNSFDVLIFSKTAAFRHASIEDGIAAIQELGDAHGFSVDTTEDANRFQDEILAPYEAVIFLSTTGDILNLEQQAAFERYIENGGGYVGIHAASDTEYSWPWYGELVGAYFDGHPAIQPAVIHVADPVHPSTRDLPRRWERDDEWYSFNQNPRGSVHVLATLDESTYEPGAASMGHDHPIAWSHTVGAGRSWYTGGGHTSESFSEPLFRQHILGGIRYAAGLDYADTGATLNSNYQKVVLDETVSNPMELTVAPDGRVFYIERTGRIKVFDPTLDAAFTVGQLPVFTGLENGLLGITLDPNFNENQRLYLFYSPAGATPIQRVSRFSLVGNLLNPASEEVILTIDHQREQCCHSAGSLTFGPNGNLFISTGDDTNPFESQGYAPIDERPGRSAWDAQKSSANANDLRGKILRIHPEPEGGYTIPDGNLFPKDGSAGRPEIYIMGCRNPFRISVDPRTSWLYWGDVGPDAGSASERGPAGHDEWNQARQAGNFGWPYFVADNKAYTDYDFASGQLGALFDPAAPVNNSPNNTGSTDLPPAQPAMIWYSSARFPEFPDITFGRGRTAMAGPVYQFDPSGNAPNRLPAYFDNTLLIYEWSRHWVREVKFDDAGNLLEINPFLEGLNFTRPIEMEVGPDGVLYLLEWGDTFNGGNSNAQLVRVDYLGAPDAPRLKIQQTENETIRVTWPANAVGWRLEALEGALSSESWTQVAEPIGAEDTSHYLIESVGPTPRFFRLTRSQIEFTENPGRRR